MKPVPLSAEKLVKLARAVDSWSGSIAVFGKTVADLVAWGVIDQLVGANVLMNRESSSGFGRPGIFAVETDGIGEISAYHNAVLLGSLRRGNLVKREADGLRSYWVFRRIAPTLRPIARAIRSHLPKQLTVEEVTLALFQSWEEAVARICIGLRRKGTGGSLLLSTRPRLDDLEMGYEFNYLRLNEGVVLSVLDRLYEQQAQSRLHDQIQGTGFLQRNHYFDHVLAEADLADREAEVTGSVKLVASLAAVDGLVLLTPTLQILGFGVKIKLGGPVPQALNAEEFEQNPATARPLQFPQFGTRHASMLRYCRADASAIGIIVSQDGVVRVLVTARRKLVIWENVRLLGRISYSRMVERSIRERHAMRRHNRLQDRSYGYTSMPKSIVALMNTPVATKKSSRTKS
jgi:hypothetical protein